MTNTKLEPPRHAASATAGLTKQPDTQIHTLQEVVNNESLVAKIRHTHTISILLIQHFLQHYTYQILIIFGTRDKNMLEQHCMTPTKRFLIFRRRVKLGFLKFYELVKFEICFVKVLWIHQTISFQLLCTASSLPSVYTLLATVSNMFHTPLAHKCRAGKQPLWLKAQQSELQLRIYDDLDMLYMT